MKHWPLKPLGEILSQRLEEYHIRDASKETFVTVRLYGKGAMPRKIGDGKTPLMRTGYQLKSGDLVYSRIDARNGAFALVGDELDGAVVSKDFPSFQIIREIIHPKYLCRFLGTEKFFYQLRASSFGTTNRQRIPEQQFLSYQIPVPPMADQERIVNLLDEADALRKLRAQADCRTAQLIPAIFYEMFADTHKWPTIRLENLCNRITVGHVGPMATEYCETGVTFLRGQNIKRGFLDLTSVLFVSEAFHRRLAKSVIRPGDVVSVRTGKPGTTAVIPPSLGIANCADLIVMTCSSRLNSAFLCELLNERLGDQENIAGATGIAQMHFNIGEARKMLIAIPPIALQNEFEKRAIKVQEMEAAQAESRLRLEALFQSLLHRAFNGDL